VFKEDKGEGPNKRLLPHFVQNIEWLRLSCLCAFLFLSGIYAPIIGIAMTLASSVPISLIGIRQGVYKAFLAVLFVAALMFLPFGEAGSVSFILGAGFLGIIFGIMVKKTSSAGEAIFGLIIAVLISKLIFMWFMIYTKGFNPFALDESSVNALMRSLNSSHVSDDTLKTVIRQINLLTPSFLIMASGLDVYVNYVLVSKLEYRRLKTAASPSVNVNYADEKVNELRVPPLPPFDQWSFPRSLLSAFLAAFLIALFDVPDTSIILISAEINLKVLTSVMFFIQGLSFAWWWMLHRSFSFRARLLIIILLMLVPILPMGLIMVGILDIVINIREKIRRNNK